ncbi:MAG: hypothetical protein ACRCZI_06160, partial [Cetobacterium sp.]
WKHADMKKYPSIDQVDDIPSKMSDFKKIYAEGIRPKSNSTCWFKIHLDIEEKIDPIHYTSTNDSETQDLFLDTGHKAYMCSVQNSDDVVDLCDFIYSGPFTNPQDFEKILRDALKETTKANFKFGCRVKKTKELPEPQTVKDWLLKYNTLLHLEVDRRQAKVLKQELYRLFNKIEGNKRRPGGYNFRVLPDKSQIRSGTRGTRDRINMLRKHQANTQSLTVFKSYDIKELDLEVTSNHNTITLREYTLQITSPLVTNKRNAPKLFFSVDFAPSGTDKTNGVVYFTAYNDRKHLAAKVVDIFPAFLNQFLSKPHAKAWCHPDSLAILDDIHFAEDEAGNPTGEWTTEEDKMGQALLEEDMGTTFDFENFELLALDTEDRVLLNADEASAVTFGSALGAGQLSNDDQQDAVIPGASQATIDLAEDASMSGADAV